MVKLWRVDAQHEADGAVTYFWYSEVVANREAERLRACGWEVDVYQDACEGTPEATSFRRLMARPWPVAPLAQLLELAGPSGTALDKARADLAAIQQRTERTP